MASQSFPASRAAMVQVLALLKPAWAGQGFIATAAPSSSFCRVAAALELATWTTPIPSRRSTC